MTTKTKPPFLDELRHIRHHSDDVPLHLDPVTLILVCNSMVRMGCLKHEKLMILEAYEKLLKDKKLMKQENPRLLACWPGKFQSHVFEVDFNSEKVQELLK